MKKVTQEDIRRAKSIGVLEYFRRFEPNELVKVSNKDYRTKSHDSLVVSENGLFHWCSMGVGGNNAIDYLLKVKGMDFISAVRLLNEQCGPPLPSFQPAPVPAKEPDPAREFRLPAPDKNAETVESYLKRRGICSRVIRYCLQNSSVYQTTRGSYKNCVFVGKDEKGVPRSALVRSCQGTWRGDCTGSQKMYGFHIPAEGNTDVVEIYEAPIDLLSGASLRLMRHEESWRSVEYLSLGGLCTVPLDHFLETHPGIRTIRICADNDPRGQLFAGKVIATYTLKGYAVENCPPQIGKDYNDLLVYTRSQQEHSR